MVYDFLTLYQVSSYFKKFQTSYNCERSFRLLEMMGAKNVFDLYKTK